MKVRRVCAVTRSELTVELACDFLMYNFTKGIDFWVNRFLRANIFWRIEEKTTKIAN